MLDSYEPFCLADPVYFERPDRQDDDDTRYAAARRAAPRGWTSTERDGWIVLMPDSRALPAQGWKVHVTATLDSAEKTIETVQGACLAADLPFKFHRSQAAWHAANFKYAARSGSGKLVTVYPGDEAELRRIVEELDVLLGGSPGPRVLGDLRWRSGPVHLRYGAFVERFCPGPDGEPVRALTGPDGRPVRDDRAPVFRVPPWVRLPDFVAAEVAAAQERLASGGADVLPYTVERALHFSNAGGVYLARDPATDRQVVLKEARPHAGLDRYGHDAVTRLDREWSALRRLAGLGVAPHAVRRFRCGEHEFLVQEFVDGSTLHRERAARHPLSYPDPTDRQVTDYTFWALEKLRQVEAALAAVHGRGLAYRDLHPGNVVVRPDGSVRLLDFELAAGLDQRGPAGLGVPGFTTPVPLRGADADRYALGCLRLSMFFPMTELLQGAPGMAERLAMDVLRRFPVPKDYVDTVLAAMGPGLPPAKRPTVTPTSGAVRRAIASRQAKVATGAGAFGAANVRSPAPWARFRDCVAGGILAAATPERLDRLYPGDPQQFRHGGHGLAYGAAGVLFALATVGAEVPESHVEWLVDAAERTQPVRIGLMDGLTGIAFALHRLGRPDAAWALTDRILDAEIPYGVGLFSGRSGVGLGLLHLAAARGCRPDPALLDRAAALAEAVVEQVEADPPVPAPGLLRGWSGPALFLTRMYAATRDPALLDAAETALGRDLARCESRAGGAVHLSDGIRVQPFLGDGSAGVGLALHALAPYRDDPQRAALGVGIGAACRAELVYETGLFHGRAGLLAYRAATGERPADLAPAARTLLRYGITTGGHTAFPGRLLLRRSTDLATGAAGVLLALHGALAGETAVLPFPGCGPFVRNPAGGDDAARLRNGTTHPGGECNVDPRPAGAGVRRVR